MGPENSLKDSQDMMSVVTAMRCPHVLESPNDASHMCCYHNMGGRNNDKDISYQSDDTLNENNKGEMLNAVH